jgi:hypothetical protein
MAKGVIKDKSLSNSPILPGHFSYNLQRHAAAPRQRHPRAGVVPLVHASSPKLLLQRIDVVATY